MDSRRMRSYARYISQPLDEGKVGYRDGILKRDQLG